MSCYNITYYDNYDPSRYVTTTLRAAYRYCRFLCCIATYMSQAARPRLWLVNVPMSTLGNLTVELADTILKAAMDTFVACAVEFHIDSFFLPEDHHILVAHRQACMDLEPVQLTTVMPQKHKKTSAATTATKPAKAKPTKSPNKKKKEHVPWAVRHADYASKTGSHDWHKCLLPSVEVQTLFPTLRRLRLREFDLMHLVSRVTEFPEPAPGRLINVSQSVTRATHTSTSHSCTIATSWRLFHTSRCRLALGVEGFNFQGIHYGERHHLLASEPDALLVSLAGNAFHGWCAAATLLAALVLQSEAAASTSNSTPSPAPAVSPVASPGPGVHGSSSEVPMPVDREAALAAMHSLWQ